jgi:hypothetical protein
VARVEGIGPITAATVRAWLRRPDASVTIRQVVVPGYAIPVDAYEIPPSVREAVRLRSPASMFPWSGCTSPTMDLDHIDAYRELAVGGLPGQTGPDGLGPLARGEHCGKTSGRWQTRSPAPGVQVWRTPHGWVHLVTNQGTFPLGRDERARAMWRAVAPSGRRRAGPAKREDRSKPSMVETYLCDIVGVASSAAAHALTSSSERSVVVSSPPSGRRRAIVNLSAGGGGHPEAEGVDHVARRRSAIPRSR